MDTFAYFVFRWKQYTINILGNDFKENGVITDFCFGTWNWGKIFCLFYLTAVETTFDLVSNTGPAMYYFYEHNGHLISLKLHFYRYKLFCNINNFCKETVHRVL